MQENINRKSIHKSVTQHNNVNRAMHIFFTNTIIIIYHYLVDIRIFTSQIS